MAILRRSGKPKPCLWRWQERFAAEGVEALIRDKTRPSRKASLPDGIMMCLRRRQLQRRTYCASTCRSLWCVW
jgi:hypothetical protein